MGKKEEWEPVKGYEGYYEISNLGRVKSLERKVQSGNFIITCHERILVPQLTKSGYYRVGLNKNGKVKHVLVHRLVAESFLPNPNNYINVHHKNADKSDERASNLLWVSRSFNIQHSYDYEGHTRANLGKFGKENKRSKPIAQMDLQGNTIKIYDSVSDVQRELGFKEGNISSCALGKYDTMYGFKWAYIKCIIPKKRVCKIKDGKIISIFETVADAARAINRSKGALYSVLSGKHKTCGGFYWKYADE